jgi:hypothetical protein
MRKRLIAILALITLGYGASAMAVEEPRFQTVLKDGAFEVRDYPALTVAEVTVTGNQSTAASRGFRLLAGYIFGANHGDKKIAMTAPVGLAKQGEKIPMTAPVGQTGNGATWVVRFTMPSALSLATLPAPNDPRVRLSLQPPVRVAALRFSGWATENVTTARKAELLERAKSHHLRVAGPVTLAQYDPPWTLPFLRRNEVMVPVAP